MELKVISCVNHRVIKGQFHSVTDNSQRVKFNSDAISRRLFESNAFPLFI